MAKAKQHSSLNKYTPSARKFFSAMTLSMAKQSFKAIGDMACSVDSLMTTIDQLPAGSKICSATLPTLYGADTLQGKLYAMRRTVADLPDQSLDMFLCQIFDLPCWVSDAHVKIFIQRCIFRITRNTEDRTSTLTAYWVDMNANPFRGHIASSLIMDDCENELQGPEWDASVAYSPNVSREARIDGYDPRGPYASRGGAIAIAQKQSPLSEEDRIAALNDELGNAINEKLNANPKKQTAHSFLLSSQESKEDMVEAARAQIAAAKASGLLR